jgi:hypothetical protein
MSTVDCGVSALPHNTIVVPNLEERFDRALVESVEETITNVLSENVAASFGSYFQAHLGLSREDIPSHLKELSSTLDRVFGVGGSVLGRAIVRRLCTKLSLSLVRKQNSSFVECIEDVKKILLEEQGQVGCNI